MRLVALLKRGVLLSAVLGFGAFTGLAISHSTGVTSATSAAQNSTQSVPATSSGENDDGGFFSQPSQGSFGFGSSSTAQPAATSTTVS
jgi:hypothetical protein